MNKRICWLLAIPFVSVFLDLLPASGQEAQVKLSDATEACLSCHSLYSQGIVKDWQQSRHARTTVRQAIEKPDKERRVSLQALEDARIASADVAVGCAECHLLDPKLHEDTFPHNGHEVHVVVSPPDCAHCHPAERTQYLNQNKMSRAHGNLAGNPVYRSLGDTVLGVKRVAGRGLTISPPSEATQMEACYGCHGTEVKVRGLKKLNTPMDPIDVPDLAGWPNTGVGRVNPDGSLGSCSACHARHSFSIALAREPQTCGQCHVEPDVPAWNVYRNSRHGNLYASRKGAWDLDAVPWRLGRDFGAPTCATCHASLVVDAEGAVLFQRTHGFGERLWVRLFGPIYSHPQPIDPDTAKIRNQAGLPLPVTYEGEAASSFLIPPEEQTRRRMSMMTLCQGCHSTQWAALHFEKLAGTLRDVDEMVRQATLLMQEAWAEGLASRDNPFDEVLEMLWVEAWLFHANSIRFTSAMAGSADYAAFHGGWWGLSKSILGLHQAIAVKRSMPAERP